MAKSNKDEIAEGLKALGNDRRLKLMREAPYEGNFGRDLSETNVQDEIIENLYENDIKSESLTFQDWVEMKDPILKKDL